MPRGRPRKIHMLQANDDIPNREEQENENFLTEEQIIEALQPYKDRGIKLDVGTETWTLTLKKEVRDTKNRLIGSGDCKVAGTRRMPIKDLLYSVRELLIPITPMTV